MGNYTILQMLENPRRDRQARNFTTNAPKILDLKWSSEQIFSRKLPLGAPVITLVVNISTCTYNWKGFINEFTFPAHLYLVSQYYLLYRRECFTGKYTTCKIHKNYIQDWFIFHNLTREFIDDLISVISLRNLQASLNFTYTFFKVLLIFCHCRALFRSVLFLKIIVNNVLYCCTVNMSNHNY